MRFTELSSPACRSAALLLAGLLGLVGCAQRPAPAPAPSPPPPPSAARPPQAVVPPALAPAPRGPVARNWEEWRRNAAQRLVQANPNGTYLGEVKQPLLAIPVLEMELNGDGSVSRVTISRRPGQAPETLQMAIDAVNRAGPFPAVSHLPKPWKYTEVFLFNDERRFKPRTLDD